MQKDRTKNASMKLIAEKAGVSIGTVDRALNNRGRIKEATRNRILVIAKELDYRPNEIARALSVNKSIKIAAIYPTEPDSFTKLFTVGFAQANERYASFGLEYTEIRTRTLDPQEILDAAVDIDFSQYDGVLINAGGTVLKDLINEITALGVPVATFNSDIPDSRRLFFSGENHFLGGQISGELAASLIQHKGNIGLFCGLPIYAQQQRNAGFMVATSLYSEIKITKTIYHDDIGELIEEKACKMISGDCPDVIFCNSATGALPLCKVIQESNLDKKVAVVGYDYEPGLDEMFENGVYNASIFQHPVRQAYNALSYMFEYLFYETEVPTSDKCTIMPTIVMKYNKDICSRTILT